MISNAVHSNFYFSETNNYTNGPENLKNSRQKNSWNQINQKFFSRNCIFQLFPSSKFHFLQFQKWPKINFWTGEKLKTATNAISRKKFFDLFDFTSFFAWTFLNFLARCDGCTTLQALLWHISKIKKGRAKNIGNFRLGI